MIHVEIDGVQFPPDDAPGLLVRLAPFINRTDTPGNLTVGVAAVQVVDLSSVPFGNKDYLINLRNTSAAGQTIGIDINNTVTVANAGILLFPGESIQLPFLYTALFAIADAAAGELRRFVLRTQ